MGEAVGEAGEFGVEETVEEEVGDDEVGLRGSGGGEGVGLDGLEAVGGEGAALIEKLEHAGAGVDGESLKRGVLVEKFGEEAAVAVAEDEGAAAGGEQRKEVVASVKKHGAEREVLGPAVDAGDGVEVGLVRHAGIRSARSGVRRTRSARARRWTGVMCLRKT